MNLILYDVGAAGSIPEYWKKKLLRKKIIYTASLGLLTKLQLIT
jgi:hypothetical protein